MQLKDLLLRTLPKNLLIDLYDMTVARARAAYDMVHEHSGLDEKRSKELVGQARFRMLEKGFQEVCQLHGGVSLDGGIIPGSGRRVFQPFTRFQGPETIGVIFGFAAMAEKRKIPAKNQSRSAGVTLNYDLSPRLDLDGTGPRMGDIFVLFMFARDPLQASKVDEVAIGVINSGYTDFVHYEPIEDFLAGYADDLKGTGLNDPNPPATTPPKALVKLKRTAKPFIPPELPQKDINKDEGGSEN
jgi:hypothetical protein